MDVAIRERLFAAESQQDVEALRTAYELIKSASLGNSALGSLENFSTDLYVLCAEQALRLGSLEMSHDCLQMYFKGRFPINQFIARAYLCQGQLHTPLSTDNLEEFEKFVMFFLKAIDFAMHDPRYYFLIYNASVLYWEAVRPYLKPGFRYCLIPSLTQIVKALNQTEEQDKEWIAELMINLLECFLDASKMEEAEEFSSTAAVFIKENAPDKYSQIFSLMVYHQLMDISQVEKEIQTSIYLSIIYKMQMIKLQWHTNDFPNDTTTNLNSVCELMKQYEASPESDLSKKIPLVLELARFSVKANSIELAYDCILDLKRAGITDPGRLIEIQCLECEYEVQKLGAKIITYTKGVVEAQLKSIKTLELILLQAIRLGDPNVIQVVCATQWNLCLPLLQHNLQQHVRKPLQSVADVLEQIDSMLILLRCQVHMEIARIEEDEDRIEAAIEHLEKAICLDSNGQYQEHLRRTFNRLRLCTMLYTSPERLEDRAVMMIEQAKKGKQKDIVRKKRSLLVNAGLALAPDSFQIVLDSENEAKVFSGKSRSQISYLSAKAQHHIKSVEKVDGHLKRLGNENDKDRIRLWADLAKVARKQGVWDVCRTACRFCLLYDDTLYRKVTKLKKTQKKKASIVMDGEKGGSLTGESLLPAKSFSSERDILKVLAEIRFINAEATVHLLRLQGIELNDPAVPPEDTSQHPAGYVACLSEGDPEWKIYSSWIDSLSQYTMENFQRAAEIGEEINEAWIVHNAVVYVLNYNKHLITAGRQREIIEHLQTLLRAIKNVGHNGSTVILLMLCNALARGLILCWIPKPKLVEKKKTDATTDKNRRAVTKGPEKASFIQLLSVDPSGLPDIKAAIEICEFALNLIARTVPTETVPISVRQQIIATWVKAKQLHHQQIGLKVVAEEENNDEAENPITRVLIGLEMYSCNNLGLMDFTLPSLSQLVKLALDSSWSDSFVELQTLTRLTHFAYVSHEYEIVMTCSQRILQSADNFCFNNDTEKCEVPENALRQEMLSTAACIQGKNIMANLSGKKHLRVAASKAFVQSARYAGEAGNYSLVMFAARQFWNTCLPLIGSPYDREQLKEPTEVILKHIIKAESKNKQEKNDMLPLHQWLTKDFQSNELPLGHFLPGAEEDLTLRTSLYGLLFHIHADRADWERALKVLDEAIQVLPRTRHRLLIFKHVVIVKARLGYNFMMDIQKFKDESEDYLSLMWRHLVTVSRSTAGQLNCFQNAIDALQKEESEWQKVDYLLEFAEWLYCNQFPLVDVIKTLHWAVDILLHIKSSMRPSQGEEKNTLMKLSAIENLKMDIGRNDVMPTVALEDLSNIKQLEAFFRAHTLMAVIFGHSSPFHQQHCLMAYACIIRIWQVSLSASAPILKVMSKTSQLTTLQNVQSIIAFKKEKDKKEEKHVKASVVKEKPKRKESIDGLPANVEEWASYDCPSEIREAFKQKMNSYGINEENFPKPTCTLYFIDLLAEELQKFFCPHLTLPIFQLAEVIASEVVECKSLSDLYHLRIALICSDLKLSEASSYHEKTVGETFISVLEQAMCRQEIALKKEKNVHAETEFENEAFLENTKLNSSKDNNVVTSNEKILELNAVTGKGLSGLSFPYIWIKKAEVLIQLGLYQPARLLLSEALTATQELRAPYDVSRCLYLFAVLANQEKKHGQAKALIEKAQLLGGNEQFWYNSTLSLVEAILEEEEEGKQSVACGILEHTVNVLRSTLLKRPNRESELHFMIASLEARKTLIQIHFAQSCMTANKTAKSSELPHMLQEPYNKLIQIEKDFFFYGYKNCSAEILLECANIHRKLAKQARNEEKHRHYLDAYNLAQRAVSEAEEVFNNISSLFAFNETTNISIPLMRQLSNRKLKFVEILLDIFRLVIIEKKNKKAGETSLHKIVEAFIRVKTEDDSTEQGWKHMEHMIGHITLAQLAHIQNLCRGCSDITSKCLCLTGKTLHLLAVNMDPLHSEIYWKPNVTEEAKTYTTNPCLTSAEYSEREMTSNILPARKYEHDKCRGKTQELKKKHRLTQNYLSQSNEVLLQCMAIAFCHNIIDVLAPASLEILECFGQFDPVLTSQFLTLHQSCLASMVMRNILLTATSNTSSSQLAALLHFQNHLKQNRDASDLQKNVEQQLTAISKAWKNLHIPVEHFNIMNELPPNFYIVILQHSEDRSNLYSSVIEKPKVSTAQQRGKPTQPVAKVSRFPMNPDIFYVLLEKVRLYKQQKMNRLKKASSQNLQECVSKTHESPIDKIDENVQDFTSDFSEIVEVMEDYLKPVLSQFEFPDTREQTASVSTESGKMKVKDKDTKRNEIQGTPMELGLCVVLLADTLLMELPLEGLSIFQEEGVCSVSRDFSLQILYNRMCVEESEIEVKNNVEMSKEPKRKADQKKNVKMGPINRVLPSNCLSVDTHNFKYIVDPYNEGKEAESVSPSQKINEILEKYHDPFTSQWEGVIGNIHTPSQVEWEQLLTNCSAFVFYGMERFLSHMLLNRLVAMNIPKCLLMILLDLVQSKQSYQRMMNSDIHKSCSHIALEGPTETAMLLSLTGVHAIIANQWYTTLQENAERLEILSENLLRIGRTTGQTVNILQKRKIQSNSVKIEEDFDNSPTENAEEQNVPTPPDLTAIHSSVFNCVLYGLPNVIIT
ncbi:cilia- and flagella-associated protein 46 [Nothoprocta perdicaria]|uniref:cilia- and flagella-associated protein 46 n=1 Tax=Nothoprocta perdicaria TaxID=30464 RepID=UPI000E1B905D|nr:cilia- and flagella-associated protein 46 [Nothoprocta perdicaria]